MNNSTLITTGITLGLIHVLAGPDHLSALAALAVGTSYRAFILGIRWGIGHSTGLIVVAIIFIMLKGDINLRLLGRYCDSMVGIFMIGLGCYGVLGALKVYKEKRNKRDPDLENQKQLLLINKLNNRGSNSSSSNSSSSNSSSSNSSSNSSNSNSEVDRATELDDITSKIESYTDVYHHDHEFIVESLPMCPFIDMHDPFTQRILSFSIGLLHGVAGPGGILGVLPAVEMQNWKSSVLYLGSFIITSTLSMGIFAALYGEITKRIGATAESVELGLSIFSSALSIIVGTIWLVLSLLGKLDVYFH